MSDTPLTVCSDRDQQPSAAQRQERFIAAARAVLKPSPVRSNHLPPWFKTALAKAYPVEFKACYRDHAMLLDRVARGEGWLDHCGSTRLHNGSIAFVSEPYGLTPGALAAVEALAERLGCRWHVSANSWWFPASTLRIVFEEVTQ